MKCVDCKIVKFDGKKYRCPAHPYVEDIDIYTEHPNCGAMTWYPKYVFDKMRTIEENVKELDEVMPKLYILIQELHGRSGYGKLILDEIEEVYQKYTAKLIKMTEEHSELLEESEKFEDKK